MVVVGEIFELLVPHGAVEGMAMKEDKRLAFAFFLVVNLSAPCHCDVIAFCKCGVGEVQKDNKYSYCVMLVD